jgi:CoA:oxalate CoA-transferase
MFAAWGIAAALYDRERTGRGRRLEVAMLDSVFSMLLTSLARRLFTNQPTGGVGNRHPETYPVDSFATRDGDIVLVGFSDSIVRRIGEVIGQPGLADDARFQTNRDRNEHEAELRTIIAQWAAGMSRDEAIAALRRADVPAAPIWNLDDLLRSGHLTARNMLRPGRNSKLGEITVVPQPVCFPDCADPGITRAPALGEDTGAVLGRELGLNEAEIARLRAAKII